MSCETETAVVLRDAGQKITPQRMLILSTLRHAGQHVTAPAVLEEVRRSYPYVDASTVYRTLGSAAALATTTSSAAPAAASARSTTATSIASRLPSTTRRASRPTSVTSPYSAS